ncbi:MAG: DsrE/DsrF-like family protein [Limnohabitans sp.]|nr:MAG: DsrE/DsrF-like family protein [Limnohabitans sp.]
MSRTIFALLLALAFSGSGRAQDKAPLFINLASEGHRATMALTFGTRQLEQGHPVTFFINSEAARLVSRAYAKQYGKQQEMIENLLDKGAVILVAPMFMQENGVSPKDLMPGVTLSAPQTGSTYLYKPQTLTLSW